MSAYTCSFIGMLTEHLYKLEDFIYKMGFVPDVRLPIEGGYEVHVWEKVEETS